MVAFPSGLQPEVFDEKLLGFYRVSDGEIQMIYFHNYFRVMLDVLQS